MVTSLVQRKTDPNGLGRGPGLYYHRGKGYYSKYSSVRDSKIKARGFKIHNVGMPATSKIRHTSDGRFRR